MRTLAMLKCERDHLVMWPQELTPYPDECPAEIGPGLIIAAYCRRTLRLQGHCEFAASEDAEANA